MTIYPFIISCMQERTHRTWPKREDAFLGSRMGLVYPLFDIAIFAVIAQSYTDGHFYWTRQLEQYLPR